MASPIPLEISGLSSRAIQVIAGLQTIYAYTVENPNAYPVYLKFYDNLWNAVNPATDVPFQKITVPAADAAGFGLAVNDNVASGVGWTFNTAISIRCTPIDQDRDTTSPATSPALQLQLDQITASGSGSGDVAGPGSSVNNNVALFSGTTGKTIKDAGLTISGSNTGDQTITLTGGVTGSGTGSFAATVANLPSGVTAAGTILQTAVAAPSTPASGKGSVYVDSTSKNLAVKDDAGVVKHGVRTQAATTNQFLTAIADDGTVSAAQPAATNVTGLAAVATSGSATDLTTGTLPAGRHPALTGDVTSSAGSVATTLANIPTDVPMAGDLLATNIAAPATPASGKGKIYVDSTSKNIALKSDDGVVKHGVQTATAVANNFVTAIDDAGVVTQARPTFTNVSGTLDTGQFPGLTGDVTASASSIATTITNTAVSNAKLANMAANTIKGNNTGSPAAPADLTPAQTKTTLALDNVENTALSTWAGSSNVTTLGTVATGTWSGTALVAGKVPSLDAITTPAADVSLNSHKITNLATPTATTDATTKAYVDSVATSGTPHPSVPVATTANLTLSGEQTVDGVTTSASRILVKDQSTAANNGIYVTAAGAWARATDANTGTSIAGNVFVTGGSVNAGRTYGLTTPPTITLGTTALSYSIVGQSTSYTASSGLSLTGGAFSALGTTNRVSVGTAIDIDANYVGQSSITTLGTVGTGTWQGSLVAGQYGGTGVNNSGKTITASANATISGTNTGDVTKSGENYLSLSAQAITANAVDLSGTNATGVLAAARHPALTGDVTTPSGSVATTLANIPSGVAAAGNILATAIAAPATPASGKGRIYVDSTSKNLAVKDDAGIVKHGVQTKAATTSQFLTAISDAGVASAAQPAFTDISGTFDETQMVGAVATGDLSGTYPSPTVVSVNGVPFANSATVDTTLADNITGQFPISQTDYTRLHLTEVATIFLTPGQGADYDTTASGTLTTISFTGSPSGNHPYEARVRLQVSNGPQTITIPSSRRLGLIGTTTSVLLNNGNHELSWISQPSGGSGALEYWLADTGDDIRQTFSNANVTLSVGTRQLAQVGTMSAARTVTLTTASSYPNGTGFWLTDESGTVSGTNKITVNRVGSDTINGAITTDITNPYSNLFFLSNGSNKWTANATTAFSGVLGALHGGTGIDTSGVTDGQILAGKTSDNSWNLTTLAPSGKISVTNGAGTITVGTSGIATDLGTGVATGVDNFVPFVVYKTGIQVGSTAATDTTVFTVPTSRKWIFTGASAAFTTVTGAAVGAMALYIRNTSSLFNYSSTTASASFTPAVDRYYSMTALAQGSSVPSALGVAGDTIALHVATAQASTSILATVAITGYYIQ